MRCGNFVFVSLNWCTSVFFSDHIVQCIEGCKLTANGEEIEIHQDAVDGKEINGKEFHRKRIYLNGNCIRWLNRYLDMKPQRKGRLGRR